MIMGRELAAETGQHASNALTVATKQQHRRTRKEKAIRIVSSLFDAQLAFILSGPHRPGKRECPGAGRLEITRRSADQTTPSARIASATFTNPATLAPRT
jgi:hypothetical protein